MRKIILFFCVATVLAAINPSASEEDKFLGSIWQNWWNSDMADPYLGTFFNQMTPENVGKWGPVQRHEPDQWNWNRLDAMMQYARDHDMIVKQHAFIWGHPHSVPNWVTNDNAAEGANRWIREFAERYPDILLVDVVNEAPHQAPSYREGLGGDGESGWDWVIWSYQRAREHMPDATLILNDYDVLKRDGAMNAMIEIVQLLQEDDLIDAIGCQAHFLENTSVADARRRLDTLYAETGLPIYISEFDLNISHDTSHRNKFRDLFTLFWEHPAVRGVTLWGHVEGTMWREHGWLVRYNEDDEPEERLAMEWLREYLDQDPGQATNPQPSNAASGLSLQDLRLQWQHGSAATRRKLYLGTSAELGPEDLLSHQYDLHYDLDPSSLQPGTTYYWRVDEYNANGHSTGDVWSFTTAEGNRRVSLHIEASNGLHIAITPDHGVVTQEDSHWHFDALLGSRPYHFTFLPAPLNLGYLLNQR